MVQIPHGPLRSFGRLKSRPVKPRQAAMMADQLPRLALPTTPFDPRALALDFKTVWLEVGFGGGEHLAAQAARHPQTLMLGAEPFVNGVASLIRYVEEAQLTNIRLHHGDVRDLLALLPDQCLDRIFILFPDPWPKARQRKRRLLQPLVIAKLARVLSPGGQLRFATDVASYADEALAGLLESAQFDWTACAADDWRRPPADHVATRYEAKGLGDCAPVFFDFVRRASHPLDASL